MAKKTNDNVILMDLNDASALKLIRELAKDTHNVAMVYHSNLRKRQRKVSDIQILNCLRKGRIIESVHRTPRGNWKLTLQYGSMKKAVRVVAVLDNSNNGNYIIVVTVIAIE